MVSMAKLNIGRAQVFIGCVAISGLYVLIWRSDWVHENIRSVGVVEDMRNYITGRSVKSSLDYDTTYIRDRSGYLYPQGYFNFAPGGVAPSFKDMDFRGRHSDSVMPICKNFTNGAGPKIGELYDYRVPRFNFSKRHKNPCSFQKRPKTDGVKLTCIPYFYFIGTPKAGSTDLYGRITMHPDVTMCGAKERRFWDRNRFRKPTFVATYSFYLYSYFQASDNIAERDAKGKYNNMIFGDGSPTYMYNSVRWYRFPGNEGCLEPRIICISYIHYINPAAKLILIMRNPVDRLYSSYLYNWERTGALRTPEQFHEWSTRAVNAHLDCFSTYSFRSCLYSDKIINETILTVAANIYSRLIMDVLKLFPREQLHVLKMEDYSSSMTTHLAEVYKYLELDPLTQEQLETIAAKRKMNKGRDYNTAGPMLPKTRKMLYNFYRPFNEELAYILKDDRYLWHEDL